MPTFVFRSWWRLHFKISGMCELCEHKESCVDFVELLCVLKVLYLLAIYYFFFGESCTVIKYFGKSSSILFFSIRFIVIYYIWAHMVSNIADFFELEVFTVLDPQKLYSENGIWLSQFSFIQVHDIILFVVLIVNFIYYLLAKQ